MTRWILVLLAACGGAGHGVDSRRSDVIATPDGERRIEGIGWCGEPAPVELDDRALLLGRRSLVVLVHGNHAAPDALESLASTLEGEGVQVVCFRWVQRGRLTRAAEALASALAQLRARHILVLGHSLGGLAARRAVTRDLLPEHEGRIDLVTVSTPFAGVRAASTCATTWLRVVSLGTVATICRRITRGSKWRDIHPEAAMITAPGELSDSVGAHLHVITEERETCRRRHADGRCAKSDYVFSVEEQRVESIADPRLRTVRVRAGHAAIVSDPTSLLDALRPLLAR